jgi:hypothetical protein
MSELSPEIDYNTMYNEDKQIIDRWRSKLKLSGYSVTVDYDTRSDTDYISTPWRITEYLIPENTISFSITLPELKYGTILLDSSIMNDLLIKFKDSESAITIDYSTQSYEKLKFNCAYLNVLQDELNLLSFFVESSMMYRKISIVLKIDTLFTPIRAFLDDKENTVDYKIGALFGLFRLKTGLEMLALIKKKISVDHISTDEQDEMLERYENIYDDMNDKFYDPMTKATYMDALTVIPEEIQQEIDDIFNKMFSMYTRQVLQYDPKRGASIKSSIWSNTVDYTKRLAEIIDSLK